VIRPPRHVVRWIAGCALALLAAAPAAAIDSYRVYPQPVESPVHTSPLPPADARTLEVTPADPTGSPFGWHDTDGAPGAEFTVTNGNNVTACVDAFPPFGDCDPGGLPDGGPALIFDFPLDLTQPPSSYWQASATQLFYWVNVLHDLAHRYGFDEPAGNFQVNNYGNGGAGGDPVDAEVQTGTGTNGAGFSTPPDGAQPRMIMYVWTLTAPHRDAVFDAGVITHEVGHGISNRLVGGPSNVSCLNNAQQPGEGLSDGLALALTYDAASPVRIRGLGNYVLGQPPGGPGIRTQLYDGFPEPNGNSWTYSSIAGSPIPFGVGEKWAQAYWEVTWRLVDEHGFDPDLTGITGTSADAGNLRAIFFFIEGLKNTVCGPTFTDVRDGILAAATSTYGGVDVCPMWEAFAAFGLGIDAVSGPPNTTTPIDGFAIPAACATTHTLPFSDGFESGNTSAWSFVLP